MLIISCSANRSYENQLGKYKSFRELKQFETGGQDYRIEMQFLDSPFTIMAPHGGGIEAGTSELAKAIAADYFNYYIFAGIKPDNNLDLHIISSRYDETFARKIINQSDIIVTIHGCKGDESFAIVGGLLTELAEKLEISLQNEGFSVKDIETEELDGDDKDNICNRGKFEQGVQIEISNGLRKEMFENLTRQGRLQKTQKFVKFNEVIQKTILEYLKNDNKLGVNYER